MDVPIGAGRWICLAGLLEMESRGGGAVDVVGGEIGSGESGRGQDGVAEVRREKQNRKVWAGTKPEDKKKNKSLGKTRNRRDGPIAQGLGAAGSCSDT